MRFVTFQYANRTSAGLVRGPDVVDLSLAYFQAFKRPYKFADLGEFLAAGALDRLAKIDFGKLKSEKKVFVPVEAATFLAPIARPPKIICVGLNYRDHAEEQGKPVPDHPLLFAKAPNIVIGPEQEVVLPPQSTQVDYEAELAVIIKDACDRVPAERAMEHVFGFTAVNDVTARDIQYGDKQWFRGKSFRTFAPMGPSVVTPDELRPDSLSIRMTLNGQTVQDGNTQNLIFSIPKLIEFVSASFPLEPGDVISTGTPAGVGVFRKPPVFLKDGDVMELAIEGIGTLRNRVIAAANGSRGH